MVKGLKNIIDELYDSMLESNPEFKQFVDNNKNNTIEDLAMEYDIDVEMLKKCM